MKNKSPSVPQESSHESVGKENNLQALEKNSAQKNIKEATVNSIQTVIETTPKQYLSEIEETSLIEKLIGTPIDTSFPKEKKSDISILAAEGFDITPETMEAIFTIAQFATVKLPEYRYFKDREFRNSALIEVHVPDEEFLTAIAKSYPEVSQKRITIEDFVKQYNVNPTFYFSTYGRDALFTDFSISDLAQIMKDAAHDKESDYKISGKTHKNKQYK